MRILLRLTGDIEVSDTSVNIVTTVPDLFDAVERGPEEGDKLFNAWVESVKDKLLIFRVEQGWKPLCDFLNADVPEKDFPRVNVRTRIRNTTIISFTLVYLLRGSHFVRIVLLVFGLMIDE